MKIPVRMMTSVTMLMMSLAIYHKKVPKEIVSTTTKKEAFVNSQHTCARGL